MIIFMDAKRAFDKNWQWSLIKALNKVRPVISSLVLIYFICTHTNTQIVVLKPVCHLLEKIRGIDNKVTNKAKLLTNSTTI